MSNIVNQKHFSILPVIQNTFNSFIYVIKQLGNDDQYEENRLEKQALRIKREESGYIEELERSLNSTKSKKNNNSKNNIVQKSSYKQKTYVKNKSKIKEQKQMEIGDD